MDDAAFQELPVWDGALHFEVTYGIGDRVGATVTVTNVGATRLTGTTTPRLWLFRAYSTPDRVGTPLWSGWTMKPWDIAESVNLAPGDSMTFLGGYLLELRSDSVAPGSYYLTAAKVFREPAIRTPFFDAGEFEIRR